MRRRYLPIVLICMFLILRQTHAVEKSIKGETEFKTNAYLHFVKGLLLEREGRLEEALKEYAETVKIDPEASYVHRSLSTLNVKIGNLDAALEAVERLKKLDDNNADTYFLAGSIYLLLGDSEKSIESFLAVLKVDPGNKDALLYLAGLTAEKKPNRAVEYLQKYLLIDPGSPDVYYELGMLYSGNKKGYSKAVKYIKKAVELDPDFFNAHLVLAQLYEEHKQYKESIVSYERCLTLSPDNKLLRAHLGLLHLQLGNIKKAEEVYQSAIGEAAENFNSLFWLGIMAEDKKDWPRAIHYLKKMIKNKKDIKSLMQLSYYYIQTGNKKKAMDVLVEAKEIAPEDVQIRVFLAYGFQEIGEIEQAIQELEGIISLDPKHVDAYFQLAVLYEQKGLFHKSIPYFYRVLEIDPKHAPAANYLGYSFADRNIKLNVAERLISIALKKEPDNAAYLDSIGWVYYRREKYSEALAELSKAAQKSDDPIIVEHVGDTYWALALLSEGRAAMTHAFESWDKALDAQASNDFLKNKIVQNKKYGLRFNKILKNIIKPFKDNQHRIENLSGFFTLTGRYEKKRFKIRGILLYESPDRIRLDLLGPFMQVWCSILYKDGDFSMNPENALDQYFFENSSIAREITLFTLAYLNGAISNTINRSGMVLSSSWRNRIISDKSVTAVLNKKTGLMRTYEYFLESGEKIIIRFKHKKSDHTVALPFKIIFSIPVQRLEIEMKFKNLKINTKFDANIFE